MKIVRNVPTYDDVLRALPPGKMLVTAMTWQGDLGPQIDDKLAKLEPLVTGFTSGRVLRAEPSPRELNAGRLWIGGLRDKIASASIVSMRGGERAQQPMVDVTEVLGAVESVRNALGANRVDFGLVTDGIRALRRARDSVLSSAAYGSGNAAEAGTADKTTTDALRAFGDRARASTRDALTTIRANARPDYYPQSATHSVDAHARGTGTPTQDSSVILAIARQGSPFTGSGQPSYQSGGARRTGDFSKPPTPAEINAANREHWKGK